MPLRRPDHAYLLDNAVEEHAPLHELGDDVVFSRIVLEKLIDLDYVRVVQVPQNAYLAEVSTRNSIKVTHIVKVYDYLVSRPERINQKTKC